MVSFHHKAPQYCRKHPNLSTSVLCQPLQHFLVSNPHEFDHLNAKLCKLFQYLSLCVLLRYFRLGYDPALMQNAQYDHQTLRPEQTCIWPLYCPEHLLLKESSLFSLIRYHQLLLQCYLCISHYRTFYSNLRFHHHSQILNQHKLPSKKQLLVRFHNTDDFPSLQVLRIPK